MSWKFSSSVGSSPWGSRTKRLIRACCTSCREKGWKAQGLKPCGVDGGELCVGETWRHTEIPLLARSVLSPPPCLGKCLCRVSENNDQNGHKKTLSCCVNNYLCRHSPSLRKKQSFLPPWAFTYGYWWTLVLVFCFLPVWVPPALFVSKPHNLISYLNYNTALHWCYSVILVS